MSIGNIINEVANDLAAFVSQRSELSVDSDKDETASGAIKTPTKLSTCPMKGNNANELENDER
jgi:hypothetical protein